MDTRATMSAAHTFVFRLVFESGEQVNRCGGAWAASLESGVGRIKAVLDEATSRKG